MYTLKPITQRLNTPEAEVAIPPEQPTRYRQYSLYTIFLIL